MKNSSTFVKEPKTIEYPIAPITLCIIAFIGGYILPGDWKLGYSMSNKEIYIKKTYQHLQIIQKELENYYAKNGHYPSNEEGLGKLGFSYKIPMTIYYYQNILRSFPDLFYGSSRYFWLDIPRQMENFYKENNHPPRNIEDLQNIIWLELEPLEGKQGYSADIDFIATPDNFFLSYKGEVFSFSLIPFIYENRNGLNPNIFSNFPHGQNSYSIKIAKNIYVYSVDSKHFYQQYYFMYTIMMFYFCIGFLMIAASFCIIIRWGIKTKKWFKVLLFALGILFFICIGSYINRLHHPKCIITDYFRNRLETLPMYQQQIQYYRDQGVITTSRYQDLINISKFK